MRRLVNLFTAPYCSITPWALLVCNSCYWAKWWRLWHALTAGFLGRTNQDTSVARLAFLEIRKAAYKTRGQKLDACSMVIISTQTIQYTLGLLFIIASLINVYYTRGTDGCVYLVPAMRHLACQRWIHTGEHMYTMWVYCSCLLLSSHMRLHTVLSLTRYMPFECTICDYRIILMPVTNRLFRIVKNLKRWTLWDYSHY